MSLSVTLNFATVDEAVAFLSGRGVKAEALVAGSAPAEVVIPTTADLKAPEPKAAKGKKSVETEKPAATPSPAPETAPAATTASEAGPKSSSPSTSATSSAPAETDYTKTKIPDAIASYIGDKAGEGYGERRAKIVALLTEFGVKKGPELKPAQFADFEAALAKVVTPDEEDLG